MSDLHTPGPWRLDDPENDPGNCISADYHFIDAGVGYHKPDGARGFHLGGWMSKADASLIAAAPVLLASLKTARILLANSISYDEAAGHHEDASYTRRRLVEIDAAIASASPEIAPTATSEPSNVVQIGDHDPELKRQIDAVSTIMGGDAA